MQRSIFAIAVVSTCALHPVYGAEVPVRHRPSAFDRPIIMARLDPTAPVALAPFWKTSLPKTSVQRPRVPVPRAKPWAWSQASDIKRGERIAPEKACSIIEPAARQHKVPVGLLTRLIWSESRFHAGAVSEAGAQGIAQFMPATAVEYGLKDPFEPRQSLAAAASLLSALKQRFGNFGLAAAAYNSGPTRVSAWLGKQRRLPEETRNYVKAVTGRSARSWAALARRKAADHSASGIDHSSCIGAVFALAEAESRR